METNLCLQSSKTVKPGATRPSITRTVMAEMRRLASVHFVENKAANEAKGKADRARKALFAAMSETGTERFNLDVETPEGTIDLVAYIATPSGERADPRLLYNLMNCAADPQALEKFLDIINVTKDSIVKELGTAAYTKIAVAKEGQPNVSVVTPNKVK